MYRLSANSLVLTPRNVRVGFIFLVAVAFLLSTKEDDEATKNSGS